MFIQTEDTPNAATMKFLPSRAVVSNPVDFSDASKASRSPLAVALFSIKGVQSVFLGVDFISVTRDEGADWSELRPSVLAAIMDHFIAERPVMIESEQKDSPVVHSAGDEAIVAQIRDLLDTRIRPAVAQDGGDVAFERYENGVVFLRLKGACAGCPGATATLKNGIENMLRHFILQVKEVRRVG